MASITNKIHYVIPLSLLAWLFIISTTSATAIHYLQDNNQENNIGEGRILWGAVADLIESSSYFPITINVPDMLAGIGSMMSNVYDYFFGGSSSTTTQSQEDVGTAHNVNHPRFRNNIQEYY